jgi:G3E family GTPase
LLSPSGATALEGLMLAAAALICCCMLIPVTLLTGFLGAGKTTLLSKLIRDPRFSDTAVVINEFGDVGLDHALVDAGPEAIIEMTSGCLCCTIRGDIRQSLLMLLERSERGEIPLFSRLIIETTGLADPAPVIHTLLADPRLVRRYALAQIVTVVDAVHGAATLENHAEAAKQVAVADVLLLSKTDITPPTPALLDALRALNPAVPPMILKDLRLLAGDISRFHLDNKSHDVRAWLAADAVDAHHHHHHDVNRHGHDIMSYCLTLDAPISRMSFGIAMELLAANQGADMLRVKGIINIAEHSDQPVVIHAVQHMMHEPVRLDAWPDDDHRSKLVFIVRGISKTTMEKFFAAWQSAEAA